MIKLRILFLNSNRIKSIESFTFDTLINLFELDLGDNQLSWFKPSTFCHLSRLGFLNLNKNKIRFYTKDTFKCLEILISIYIFYGEIRFDAFEYLLNVQKLNIESVYIPLLNNRTINGLTNLDHLSVYRSRMVKIDSNFVQSLDKLHHVTISDNIIDELGEYLFYNLT
jgi:Leucine-rich repeat (LRR) protein